MFFAAHKTSLSCDDDPFLLFFLRPLARFVLKGFAKDGRDLTDKETKAFLSAADKDGDGKIGVDGKHQILLVGASRGHTSGQYECRERESDKRRQSVFTCCRLRFTTYSFTGCLLRLQPHCGFTLCFELILVDVFRLQHQCHYSYETLHLSFSVVCHFLRYRSKT